MEKMTYTQLKSKAAELGIPNHGVKKDALEKLVMEKLQSIASPTTESDSVVADPTTAVSNGETEGSQTYEVSMDVSPSVSDATVDADITVEVNKNDQTPAIPMGSNGTIEPPQEKKKVKLVPKPDHKYVQGEWVQDVRTGEKFTIEFVASSGEVARRINMTEKGLKFYPISVLRPWEIKKV